MKKKTYLEEFVEGLPLHRRIWWEVWHTRLYWWLIKVWDWVWDEPYWNFPEDGEPYLTGLRTGRPKPEGE